MVRPEVNLPLSIFKDGDAFVAYTPALDLSTSGKTFQEAERRFYEAVELFFTELTRMGTLDQTLAELGWKKVKQSWRPPSIISHSMETVLLPA